MTQLPKGSLKLESQADALRKLSDKSTGVLEGGGWAMGTSGDVLQQSYTSIDLPLCIDTPLLSGREGEGGWGGGEVGRRGEGV